MSKYWVWGGWCLCTGILIIGFSWSLFGKGDKTMFLVGQSTSGHHQIEEACESCHVSPFGGEELLQESCEGCHLDELNSIRDSHPKRKFTDPSNADRIEVLDARLCVSCHREHQEEITSTMGLTVAEDVCFLCHEEIGEERSSHQGMEFDTCATSGCHNFHDNTALYETFLVENANQPMLSEMPLVAPLNALEQHILGSEQPTISIIPNAPAHLISDEIILEWKSSAHAITETNCLDCHSNNEQAWIDKPAVDTCGSCHDSQTEGFLQGKHGMRLAVELSPMTPAMARIPMHDSSSHIELNCTSCHSSHAFNLEAAAIDACLTCHNSEHSQSYKNSPHFDQTQLALSGQEPENSAVTCATCHMPRETTRQGGVEITHVQHNQNLNLRPNDKMIRSVCMSCHSLEFSIDALADTELINSNFNGSPLHHVESIDMALDRRAGVENRDNTYR